MPQQQPTGSRLTAVAIRRGARDDAGNGAITDNKLEVCGISG